MTYVFFSFCFSVWFSSWSCVSRWATTHRPAILYQQCITSVPTSAQGFIRCNNNTGISQDTGFSPGKLWKRLSSTVLLLLHTEIMGKWVSVVNWELTEVEPELEWWLESIFLWTSITVWRKKLKINIGHFKKYSSSTASWPMSCILFLLGEVYTVTDLLLRILWPKEG